MRIYFLKEKKDCNELNKILSAGNIIISVNQSLNYKITRRYELDEIKLQRRDQVGRHQDQYIHYGLTNRDDRN